MKHHKPIYIINGPNLNLLEQRDAKIYGRDTLEDIETSCNRHAQTYNIKILFEQSNEEGKLVNLIQEARQKACAVIINAGAYTHTSIAILDTLQILKIPIIEVHLSNIFKREDFRHHSYISPVAQGVICGFGIQSYLSAIDILAVELRK